jgi:excisionase family DNA binding protein
MSHITQSIQGDGIWCPLCQSHTKFLRVVNAAKITDVHRRTIYRYIDSGAVHVVKVIGTTTRVCSGCLLNKKEGGKNNFCDKL